MSKRDWKKKRPGPGLSQLLEREGYAVPETAEEAIRIAKKFMGKPYEKDKPP